MSDSPRSQPRRVLQIYNREQQAQFKHMDATAKLQWLESICRLYWAGVQSRESNRLKH